MKSTCNIKIEGFKQNLLLGLSYLLGRYVSNGSKTNHLETSYNVASSIYESIANERLIRTNKFIKENILFEKENMKVLDVGCGPGTLTKIISEEKRILELYGVDLSPDMLKIAKTKCKNLNAEFIKSDVLNMPFKDEYFDVVVSGMAFHHFADQSDALKEMLRVTKKGGQIGISIGGPKYMKEIIQAIINVGTQLKWFKYYVGYGMPYWPLSKENLRFLFLREGVKKCRTYNRCWVDSYLDIDEIMQMFDSITGRLYLDPIPQNRRDAFMQDVKSELKEIVNDKYEITENIVFCFAMK